MLELLFSFHSQGLEEELIFFAETLASIIPPALQCLFWLLSL